jgi:thiamine-phosphate pyrophosphorylase
MLIFVTNRKLCHDEFLLRVEKLAKGKPDAIILREKDLCGTDYENLAISVNEICLKSHVRLIINSNIETALNIKADSIHLSFDDMRSLNKQIDSFNFKSVSVHSPEEAKKAQELGASHLIAGHIFPTECKKGSPPRGLRFLEEICSSVSIPVFAIGGITKESVKDVLRTGAAGICIMSEAMTSSNPLELAENFRDLTSR